MFRREKKGVRERGLKVNTNEYISETSRSRGQLLRLSSSESETPNHLCFFLLFIRTLLHVLFAGFGRFEVSPFPKVLLTLYVPNYELIKISLSKAISCLFFFYISPFQKTLYVQNYELIKISFSKAIFCLFLFLFFYISTFQ